MCDQSYVGFVLAIDGNFAKIKKPAAARLQKGPKGRSTVPGVEMIVHEIKPRRSVAVRDVEHQGWVVNYNGTCEY